MHTLLYFCIFVMHRWLAYVSYSYMPVLCMYISLSDYFICMYLDIFYVLVCYLWTCGHVLVFEVGMNLLSCMDICGHVIIFFSMIWQLCFLSPCGICDWLYIVFMLLFDPIIYFWRMEVFLDRWR